MQQELKRRGSTRGFKDISNWSFPDDDDEFEEDKSEERLIREGG